MKLTPGARDRLLYAIDHCSYALDWKANPTLKIKTSEKIEDKTTHAGCTISQCDDPSFQRGLLVVAFPCTHSPGMVIQDVNCWMKKYSIYNREVRLAAGFLSGWLSLRQRVLSAVARYAPYNHIMVTGYSWGGAVASIAGTELAASYRNIEVITCEQPRAGDGAFCEVANSLLPWKQSLVAPYALRLQHGQDPFITVPRKEPCWNGRLYGDAFPAWHFHKGDAWDPSKDPLYEKLVDGFIRWLSARLGNRCDLSQMPEHSLSKLREAVKEAAI